MADVASTLAAWSTTRSSNAPSGSATAGAGIDDNLREIQGVVRGALAYKGLDIAAASTVDVGSYEGSAHDITGTATITSLGTISAGIVKRLVFQDVCTITHNATSLKLPGGLSITTSTGDAGEFESLGSGNWRCNWFTHADGSGTLLAQTTAAADKVPYFTGTNAASTADFTSFGRSLVAAADAAAARALMGPFPSGTVMVFVQPSAPIGWTKSTAHDDKALRIVSSAGGATSGATVFSSVFGASKSTSSYTLTTTDIPTHSHDAGTLTGLASNVLVGIPGSGPGSSGGTSVANVSVTITGSTGSTGSGGGHSHGLSLDLAYVDCILATKD